MSTKTELHATTTLARPLTILFSKDKGGVGLSHSAMATGTLLRSSAQDAYTTVIVDLDGSTGTTIGKMGERDPAGRLLTEQSLANGVPAIDLFDPTDRTQLFDLCELPDRFLLLDGPAASLKTLRELNTNLSATDWVEHNAACGRDLVVVIGITPHLASITDVPTAIDLFGPTARYVVIRSMRDCGPRDYVLWDEADFTDVYGNVVSGNSKARLEAAGGIVLDMPALSPGVLARAEAMKIPLGDAVSSPHLRVHERLSVRRWLTDWAAQLDRIRGPLGLASDFEWVIR